MRTSSVATAAGFLLAACASSTSSGPTPVEVQSTGVPGQAAAVNYQKVTATVQAIDRSARTATLKTEDGKTQTIKVAPELTRFDEVSVGDTVQVELQEGLLLEYQPAGTAFVAPAAVVAGGRAGYDSPPGIAVGGAVQSTVTIIAIDLKSRVVQFQDPDGNKYQVKAGPKLAIEKLTVGDRLVATYVAEVAVTVDKKSP